MLPNLGSLQFQSSTLAALPGGLLETAELSVPMNAVGLTVQFDAGDQLTPPANDQQVYVDVAFSSLAVSQAGRRSDLSRDSRGGTPWLWPVRTRMSSNWRSQAAKRHTLQGTRPGVNAERAAA